MEQHKPSLIKSLSLLTAVIGLQACEERLVASAQDRPAPQVASPVDTLVQTTPDTLVQITTPEPPLLPHLSHHSGQYPEAMAVQLAYLEPGVEYRYTLDGREPDLQSPLYLGPIQIQSDAVLAIRGWRDSLPGPTTFENYLVRPVQKDSVLDLRDGRWYHTVRIAGKEWMAENLDYTDSIGRLDEKPRNFQIDSLRYEEDWDYQDSVAALLRPYTTCSLGENGADLCVGFGPMKLGLRADAARPDWGRFYFGTENVCMEGWHVPESSEWKELLAAAGEGMEGTNRLKSVSWWSDDAGLDALGFRVLPTGFFGSYRFSLSLASSSGFDRGRGTAFWVSGQPRFLVIKSGSPALFADGMREEGATDLKQYPQAWAAPIRCVRD
ncbi:MAG: chitobiase/beta-hexosaminidase C-terminal domain-containing protein [Fibrobacteres bacterium]|nr:chitobiase/beta-hexosaminidase C-terminal domain-containing protein [Fibrobacterota bacterium]